MALKYTLSTVAAEQVAQACKKDGEKLSEPVKVQCMTVLGCGKSTQRTGVGMATVLTQLKPLHALMAAGMQVVSSSQSSNAVDNGP